MDEHYVDFEEMVEAIHFKMHLAGISITKEQIVAVYDAETEYLFELMEDENQ